MAKFRLKMLPLNLLALVSLMAWGTSASAAESAPSPSLSAEVELICHTDNPAECYPKLFQATDEFQIVHPDQDLPQGLHVRLNVNTGLKEAKINVPDELDPALEGLPVDSSIVIVERDQPDEDQDQDPIPPPNAPAFDSAGAIKKPKSADQAEGSAFYKSLTILKKGLDIDDALEMLEDISHDIYYGLKIAEDYDTVHELFCLSTTPPDPANAAALSRARLASLTLASTLQNNAKALAEIEAHWPKLSASVCSSPSGTPGSTPLGTSIFSLLPSETTTTTTLPNPSLTKTRISLLTSLLKSPLIRTAFLSLTNTNNAATATGPSHILRILTTTPPQQSSQNEEQEAREWTQTQRRAALLLLDTFLDTDMGAVPGQWPTRGQLSDSQCADLFPLSTSSTPQQQTEDGEGEKGLGWEEECVHWLIKGLSEKRYRKEKEHWSHELWRGLKVPRKEKGRDGEKVEL
ncbi:uncharacterized protein C8A04DRAFT_13473 [Dichotomopilus funicola]|uniref:Nucleotide exchange factor SIL1 n=1 Tax=Dichotomopilus funicola TaxID=1934379 RepID=A0AAN6UZK3_9PEZI|nr:hypothetical protein C8A04DRAFT_13473 [Dichotomopilus funicola]